MMSPSSSRLALVAAFAAVYVIWGSTYLAIKVGLETLPPFALAGVRFLVVGGGLYAALRLAGVPRPSDRQWWWAALSGCLMLVGGTGGLTWGEQLVASGPACLLVAVVPLWMTLIDTVVLKRRAPAASVVAGIALGLAGVGVLVGGDGVGGVAPLGAAVIMVGSLSWSVGSLIARAAPTGSSPMMSVAIQNLVAGVVLSFVSGLTGEWSRIVPSAVSLRSVAALGYLVVFGSLIAYTAYVWLLGRVSAAAVATYAFVNPVVAVLLGWAAGGEELSPRLATAMAMIVGAVVLIQARSWSAAWVASRRPAPPAVATLPALAPAGAVAELAEREVA